MARSPETLLLFTTTFPFGAGEAFLEAELPHLADRFARVVIVPIVASGSSRALPRGVHVDTTLAELRRRRGRLMLRAGLAALGAPAVFRELTERPSRVLDPRALWRAFSYWGDAFVVCRWLQDFWARSGLQPASTICYAYWLNRPAMGVGLAKARHPACRLFVRAHGSDLNEFDHDPPYLPFRASTLGPADRLFTVSDYGLAYLGLRHPAMLAKAEVARLGVVDPGFEVPCSDDGVLRLVSCSFIVPGKRLERWVAGLAAFAEARPEAQIEWHHLGDGPGEKRLAKLARAQLPPNVRWRLHGRFDPAGILAFYRAQPLDGFVTTSRMEGVPVTIMEALSCGIPVLATAVGGIPELVDDKNGLLLPADPSPAEVAAAIGTFEERARRPEVRQAARATWRALCRADTNFSDFARRIAQLGRSAPEVVADSTAS